MKRSSQIARSISISESTDTKNLYRWLKSEGFEKSQKDIILSIMTDNLTSEAYQEILGCESAAADGVTTPKDVDALTEKQKLSYYLTKIGDDRISYLNRILSYSSVDEAADDSEKRFNKHPKVDQMLDFAEAHPEMSPEEIMRAMESDDEESDGDNINEESMRDIDTEVHIPVKDIYDFVKKDKNVDADMDVWSALDSNQDSVKKYVDGYIDSNLKGSKAQKKAVNFLETDSGNPSHANAIYSVVLRGGVSELKNVAGEDKVFFYPNDKLNEGNNIDVADPSYDYGSGFGDVFDINRIPKLNTLDAFENVETKDEIVINEVSFKEDDKVAFQSVDTVDGGTITGDYVVLGQGTMKADGRKYDVLIVQDDDGVPHSKGGMKIWTVYANSGIIAKRKD